MSRRTLLTFTLLWAIAGAGCATQLEPSKEGMSSSTASEPAPRFAAPSATTTQTTSEDVPRPSQLILDNCVGIDTLRLASSELVGASPPPSWGPGPTPVTELRIEISNCERLSLGPFERGPIYFLVEIHDNREPPESCRNGEYTSSEVITQVWVDDGEVADYLQNVLGLPAKLAKFHRDDQLAGDLNRTTWHFEIEGFEPSYLDAVRPSASPTPGTYLYRRFWVNEVGGISYMDFETKFQRTSRDSVATGIVSDPFLHMPGDTSFVGTESTLDSGSIIAPITRFGDLKCEHPY
jgi:hypothetical protein